MSNHIHSADMLAKGYSLQKDNVPRVESVRCGQMSIADQHSYQRGKQNCDQTASRAAKHTPLDEMGLVV